MSWHDAQTLTLYRSDPAPSYSHRVDRTLMLLAFILIAIGIGMIYSASAVMAQKRFGDSAYFLKRQLVWLAVGMVLLMIFARTDLKTLRAWGVPILLIGLVALVAVLLPMIGVSVKGARRWLKLGSLTIQPAELIKVGVLLYLAHYLAKKGERIEDFRLGFVPPLVVIGLVMALVLVEPDLGTATVIGLVSFGLLFVGGARLGHLSLIGLAALPALYLLIAGVGYRRQRMLSFLDPWSDPEGTGFQVIQSFLALGGGGPFGVGLGEGRQKLFFLPEPHTDFVLSMLGEEFGFLGTSIVIVLLAAFVAKGFMIALAAEDPFGRYLAFGVSFLVAFHTLINVGAISGLLPTKGLPLPFLSYGGSSLIVNMIGTGMLMSVSRNRPSG
ncbi:MAG TPA: putative lipid II flippase FtsW [Nitrospirales bacterium]|jgi:cell division protein FtsW